MVRDGCVGDPAPDPLSAPPLPDGSLRAALPHLHSDRVGVALPPAVVEAGEKAADDLPGMDGPCCCLTMSDINTLHILFGF